jgi:hypothetical protein
MKKTKKKSNKSSVRLVNQRLSEWRVFAEEFEKPTQLEIFDENQRWIPGGVRFVIYKVCYDSKGKPNGIVEFPDTTVQVNYSDPDLPEICKNKTDDEGGVVVKVRNESQQNLMDMCRAWDLPILEEITRTGNYRIREWKGTKEINRLERMCECPKKTKRKTKR